MPEIGEVWKHSEFYCDKDTGEPLPKYLLIIGAEATGDIIYKLLTSRPNGRPCDPACYHGLPYPSYYIGIPQPSGCLCKPTWIDLRESETIDYLVFNSLLDATIVSLEHTISNAELVPILECAAQSDDITKRQRDAVLDAKERIS